jgi:hypothetical protein
MNPPFGEVKQDVFPLPETFTMKTVISVVVTPAMILSPLTATSLADLIAGTTAVGIASAVAAVEGVTLVIHQATPCLRLLLKLF